MFEQRHAGLVMEFDLRHERRIRGPVADVFADQATGPGTFWSG